MKREIASSQPPDGRSLVIDLGCESLDNVAKKMMLVFQVVYFRDVFAGQG